MKPFIDSAFWSDPDVEFQPSTVKLTLLWLITNSRTNLLGICSASPKRFEFETGLAIESLEATVEALPRALKGFEDNIFIRNFVRHQFGSGEKLTRNNFFVALKSLFLSIRDDDLRAEVLLHYPEFTEAQKGFEGLTNPKDRIGKEREGTGKESRGGAGGDSQAEEIYLLYPRKVGRPEAIRAIKKALAKHGCDLLKEKTSAYARARGTDLSFVPNPATWFNQERFNDAPETWHPQRNGNHTKKASGACLTPEQLRKIPVTVFEE